MVNIKGENLVCKYYNISCKDTLGDFSTVRLRFKTFSKFNKNVNTCTDMHLAPNVLLLRAGPSVDRIELKAY